MYKVFVFLTILVTLTSVKALTDCEEHRKRESNSNAPLPMRLIPECDNNGEYKSLQCFQNSKFCACWNKNGDPLTQPSGKIKACDCLVQKHEVEKKGLVGAFKPQCEEDGKFKKEQCHGSTGMCWCAHPVTGEKTTEPGRGKPKCK